MSKTFNTENDLCYRFQKSTASQSQISRDTNLIIHIIYPKRVWKTCKCSETDRKIKRFKNAAFGSNDVEDYYCFTCGGRVKMKDIKEVFEIEKKVRLISGTRVIGKRREKINLENIKMA